MTGEPTHSTASTRKPTDHRTPDAPESDSFDQETPLPSLVQQMRLDPRLLTPAGILQLQRTIGNVATQRLVNQVFSRPKQIRSINPVIQLAQDAKKSIAQPTQNQSATVPDLPQNLVNEINQAKTARNETARNTVLTSLFTYLQQKDAVVSLDLGVPPTNHPISVVSGSVGGNLAVTQVINQGRPNEYIKITVAIAAFQDPAILYSTLRHELIHVAQRMNAPDSEQAGGTKASDEYIYEDTTEAVNRGSRQFTDAIVNNIQLPLQEIETHAWEILHAAETGINVQHYTATLNFLATYLDTLINYCQQLQGQQQKGNVPDRLLKYWKGYFKKASSYVDAVLQKQDVQTILSNQNSTATWNTRASNLQTLASDTWLEWFVASCVIV